MVNVTKTLTIQKDYFKDHPIWKPLEKELLKKRNNLSNEQLAAVIYAFGVTGNGSKEFFAEFEETIIDSPIPIESEHLEKIVAGYAQIDLGTPVFYSRMVEQIVRRGMDRMSLEAIVELGKNLKKATNAQKGAFGYFEAMEKLIH